jgi:hypothetical protein
MEATSRRPEVADGSPQRSSVLPAVCDALSRHLSVEEAAMDRLKLETAYIFARLTR